MSEYLIQGETLTALADHARRLSGSLSRMSAADILEVASRTQGTVKTDGEYSVKAISGISYRTLKSGTYDTDEIFSMPAQLPLENDVLTHQGWASSEPINSSYIVIGKAPAISGSVYIPADNKDTVVVNITTAGTTVSFRYISQTAVLVDWGDGTTSKSTPGYILSHVYDNTGTYHITIEGERTYTLPGIWSFLNSDDYGVPYCDSIYLAPYVTSIAQSHFRDMASLKHVTIPIGVEKIGKSAFANCTSLQGIIIPNSVTSIGSEAFEGCSSLENIVLPYGLSDIPDSMCEGCTSLTEVIIPNTVKTIGASSFYNNISLSKLIVPESVTTIGENAFAIRYDDMRLDQLRTVILPSVNSIGDWAFRYREIENLVLNVDTVCTLGTDVFFNIVSIYVPDNLVDSYKSAENWSTYASRIKPLSEYTASTTT